MIKYCRKLFLSWDSHLQFVARACPSAAPATVGFGETQKINSQKMDSGEKRLLELGYKQELKRDLSFLSNFAISFAILSVMAGITTTFSTGLAYGGIISMTWGWLITGFFTLFVGLGMAEICSAFPTSGGLYFWSAQLAGAKWSPFASWITGWYNVVGQWAATCGVCFSLTQLLQVIVLLSTGGANGGGYVLSKYAQIGLQAIILVSLGFLNCLPVHYLAYIGNLAMVWNVLGVFLLTVLIPAVAVERQTASFVFTSFYKPDLGISSNPYIFFLGLLMSQYALAGFDASAHMTEETKLSDRYGAYGILSSILVSIVVGWGYILGLTFTVIDPTSLLDPANDAGGYAVAQLFYGIFRDRYGSGTGGIVCLGIIAVAVYLGGLGCVTSNSRMVYAFSRDGALPLSRLWHKVNKHDVPVNAVWLSCCIAFIMALPSLGSVVAFQAMVSIAVIGLYIAYVLPIFFRVTVARHTFVRGPVRFGGEACSLFIGWVAVLWVITITVLFCLPVSYPVTDQSLNYTPVAVGGVFVLTVSYWLISGRKWFKGPQVSLHKDTDRLADSKLGYANL